jgi:hypothetical protein
LSYIGVSIIFLMKYLSVPSIYFLYKKINNSSYNFNQLNKLILFESFGKKKIKAIITNIYIYIYIYIERERENHDNMSHLPGCV